MRWEKKGLVYSPDKSREWASHSALTPTPILIDDKTIRIYAGMRDIKGVSRIGFVDVDAENPARIIGVSKKPVLDVGLPGTFDDNGVILGDIVSVGKQIYMFYIGFQLVEKVKFLAFTGLAISGDSGNTFVRYSDAPILDRSRKGLFFRAIHSVNIENGIFRVWYAMGSDWQIIQGKSFPKYNIHYIESPDGITFHGEGMLCVDVRENEYRIGRPRVFRKNGQYGMHYTKGTLEGNYHAGYAESNDGLTWIRKDDEIGIGLSESGWDSRVLAYPALIQYQNKTYMFYNGNDMGREGFGYAILVNN